MSFQHAPVEIKVFVIRFKLVFKLKKFSLIQITNNKSECTKLYTHAHKKELLAQY